MLHSITRLRTAQIVLFIILTIAMTQMVMTSVTTSYEKLRQLSEDGHLPLLKSIEATISEKLDLIRNLTTILSQYSQTEVHDLNITSDHPNDFYLLVKHHIATWYYGGIHADFFPALEKIIEDEHISFPKEADLNDALLGLIRLQYVYKLKARDMFEGNYMGYMGSPLSMEDAYLLGKQAFEVGKLPECIQWLELDAELQKTAQQTQAKNISDDGEQMSRYDRIRYVTTLSLLGRAHFYLTNTDKARELYIQCNESAETDDENMRELLIELEAKNVTKVQEGYDLSVRDIDDNITELCSRDKDQRVSVLRPYHMCRYKSNAFIPYQRFQEEILSTSPYASVFYDVIYDAEIERLTSIAMKGGLLLRRAGRSSETGQTSYYRTGDLGWVEDDADPLVAGVSERVKAFTGLDATHSNDSGMRSAEVTQVANYGIGGHFEAHYDPFRREAEDFDNRLVTVLFYLTEVEKGGATIFPKVGISVSPVKGMALMWYNYPPHLNDIEDGSLHAGCPVMKGNKWIATKWIWSGANMFRRPCGPSVDSRQMDVEKIVPVDALKVNDQQPRHTGEA